MRHRQSRTFVLARSFLTKTEKARWRYFQYSWRLVLAEFSSAVAALECAAEFQAQMKERNESSDASQRMEFRIGVNMGDVVKEDGNLYGDGVNIAARLEFFAQPNGISISKPVYDFVKGKTGLFFNDLGIQQVKENKFQVYDVLLDPSHKRRIPKGSLSQKPLMMAALAVVLIASGHSGLGCKKQATRRTAHPNLPMNCRRNRLSRSCHFPICPMMKRKNISGLG